MLELSVWIVCPLTYQEPHEQSSISNGEVAHMKSGSEDAEGLPEQASQTSRRPHSSRYCTEEGGSSQSVGGWTNWGADLQLIL